MTLVRQFTFIYTLFLHYSIGVLILQSSTTEQFVGDKLSADRSSRNTLTTRMEMSPRRMVRCIYEHKAPSMD